MCDASMAEAVFDAFQFLILGAAVGRAVRDGSLLGHVVDQSLLWDDFPCFVNCVLVDDTKRSIIAVLEQLTGFEGESECPTFFDFFFELFCNPLALLHC